MLIVMLLLLSATAVATFAVQSTSYEIRAVGGNKLFVQAETASEIALDSVFALVEAKGPEAIDEYLVKAPVWDEDSAPFKDWDAEKQAFERTLGRGTDRVPCGIDPRLYYDTGNPALDPKATRIPLTEIASYKGAMPIDMESLGARPDAADPTQGMSVSYFPSFYICAYDQMLLETPTAGQELGTTAAKHARRVTLTAQSSLRLWLPNSDTDGDGDFSNNDAADGFSTAGYHEVSNSARAHALTIPYANN